MIVALYKVQFFVTSIIKVCCTCLSALFVVVSPDDPTHPTSFSIVMAILFNKFVLKLVPSIRYTDKFYSTLLLQALESHFYDSRDILLVEKPAPQHRFISDNIVFEYSVFQFLFLDFVAPSQLKSRQEHSIRHTSRNLAT